MAAVMALKVNGKKNGLLREISECKESLRLERVKNVDQDMSTLCKEDEDLTGLCPAASIKCRKTLKGHRGKILHFDWSPDKNHLMTAGQDGYAFIWNCFTGRKEIMIQTTSPSVLACAYSPSTTMVACGGMENQCSIYKIENRFGSDDKAARIGLPNAIVAQHSKFITNCSFFGSDQQLLTSSADSTCALWDLEREEAVQRFLDHRMEVLGLAIHPRDPYTVFASGSYDGSTCLWDVRTGVCEMKFTHQETGVTAVKFQPGGEAIASAGNDGAVLLYDLRADQQTKFYSKPSIVFGATSVDFSRSGRVMYVGYNDYSVRAWDILKGGHLNYWLYHQDRVSHIQMSPDGTALGTSSWDGTLRIMA